MQITITVNGTDTNIRQENDLQSILSELGYQHTHTIAVAVNQKFISKENHETTIIREKDQIEVVAPMQGG